MKLFFDPETVALIGASAKPVHPGHHLFESLEESFGDKFYPVNSRVDRIKQRPCFKSILDVPGSVDTAVIFIPARAVPESMEQCGQRGIKRVIIESGGFAEVGGEGVKIHEQCLEVAARHDMRVWGPNCMGAINVTRMKVLSFMSPFIWKGRFIPGKVSMVVQSGMLSAGFLVQILHRTPFGLSKVASIGNKMDVDEVDVLEYLLDDPDTGVIAMYLESLSRGRRFFEMAKNTDKPIVVLKAGRTDTGLKAAASHTAAMAQDEAVLEAALRQAGVIRVMGMQEMMDVARCLAYSSGEMDRKTRVAIISFSGGAGVVASDDISDYGMELADLRPETIERIKTVYPDWMDPENPVDLYPGIEKYGPQKAISEAIEAVFTDPGVDAVYAHLFAPPGRVKLYDYDRLAELINKHNKPIVVWTLGAMGNASELSRELEKRGIPVVDEIRKGVRILAAMTMRK
jgi:acetyltransferase